LKTSIKPTAPRIDVEPLYVAVKGAISDADWSIYKATIRDFLLGRLNQEEVSSRLDRILSTPALEHAHNQFIVAIYQNSLRDPPEPGTASWADDKVVGKSGAGGKGASAAADEAEKRLKFEVMQLARRERKRLKGIQDVPGADDFGRMMQEMVDSKRIRTPDTGPASAGGFQKTSKHTHLLWLMAWKIAGKLRVWIELHANIESTRLGH
jgi:transcriptional coactivator HFI1/ADA1